MVTALKSSISQYIKSDFIEFYMDPGGTSTAVLNKELRQHFERWYPGMAANDARAAKAA